MAAKRPQPNLPINYEEQFAKEASGIAKRIAAPSGDRIRFNSNRSFITPDGMEGETLEVVIVDFMSSNMFYDGQFDRDNPQPPACFAIGEEPSMLIPSSNSPNKQAETCSSCPNNQFGSSPTGRGKACKNTRLLAVMPADALESEDEAPVWIMAIPPTSLKAFDNYVSTLSSRYKTIPLGVVTQITMDSTATFAAPRFSVMRPLQSAEIGTFAQRREEATRRLTTEPDVSGYTPPKQVGRGPAPRARR